MTPPGSSYRTECLWAALQSVKTTNHLGSEHGNSLQKKKEKECPLRNWLPDTVSTCVLFFEVFSQFGQLSLFSRNRQLHNDDNRSDWLIPSKPQTQPHLICSRPQTVIPYTPPPPTTHPCFSKSLFSLLRNSLTSRSRLCTVYFQKLTIVDVTKHDLSLFFSSFHVETFCLYK